MALTVAEMLEDPFVAATDPVVVTGSAGLERPVRWVHATEKLDIAPLLLGGEVVLMEGLNLRQQPVGEEEREHVAYVESLVEAGVAALAVELTDRLPAVPAPVVDAAARAGLPVIAMRRRVPFVQICQSVNTRLSDGSLRQLRLADRLSAGLAEVAAVARTVEPLLEVIARETRADVTLVGLAGEEIARAGARAGDDAGTEAFAGSFSAPLRAGQATCGTLLLRARAEADIHSVAVALDRAPQVLTISLLQLRPPSIEERLTAELFALLTRVSGRDRSADALQVEVYLDRLGLPADASYLCLSAGIGGDRRRLREVRAVIGRVAPHALVQLSGDELLTIMPFAVPAELENARTALLSHLPPADGDAVACVGAGVRRRRDLAREVTAVRTVRSWLRRPPDEGVVDARDHAVERLVRALEDAPGLDDFVEEVLGPLAEGGAGLLETLATYAAQWGSKTATAAALGIGRQTLYQRLDRIETLIGPLDASPARAAAVMTAAFVQRARRSLPPGR